MTDHFVDTTKMVSLNPLPELVYRLRDEAPYGNLDGGTKRELHLIDAAYRAGADAELEACCEWLEDFNCSKRFTAELRAARRPKPPSLKELNLKHLEVMERDGHYLPEIIADLRRAIESLPS